MEAAPSLCHCNQTTNAEDNATDTNLSRPMNEIENGSSETAPIERCEKKAFVKRRATLDASEATSSYSSANSSRKSKSTGIACKRRNPRVLPVRRRIRGNVADIGLPLGMSFAAVMAQVLYRKDSEAERMSPDHLSVMCTSAIKESLANVFGGKLDGLTRNFEHSFCSTFSTLRLIYESSSTTNEGDKVDSMKMENPNSKLTPDKGNCSSDVVMVDHSEAASHADLQDQSVSSDEVKDNFHMNSVGRDLTLHRQSSQMVCFSPTSSGSVSNNAMISTFEKSVLEQCRSNDLKTLELNLTMQKLKLKETQLALNFDLNNLERSKLAMGVSKASFKAEKFKTELEDMRHNELHKKCIDCLIAGLLVMSSALLYGAYAFSYERIVEATGSCTTSNQGSFSWWTPKSVISFNARLLLLWCQVQVMSRMIFGVLMIFAIAYLLIQRSTSTSQTMPVTFILLMLGIGCGYCGKLCVDTLGGSGYVWFFYWEILCLLHFFSLGCTSLLYQILHGSVTKSQTTKGDTIFPYWIRRVLFYAILLAFLPILCGLMPFASIGQWKDHFWLKLPDYNESDW